MSRRAAQRWFRALLVLLFSAPAAARADFLLPLDDFLCYRSVTTPGTHPIPVLFDLHLADRFEDVILDAEHQRHVCFPAAADGGAVIDPDTSLRTRFLRSNGQTPSFVRVRRLTVTDRFGTLAIDLVRRSELLIPATVGVGGPLPPPDSTQHDVDHFKCYRPGGVVAPRGNTVTIADRFTTPRLYTVGRPEMFCAPVDEEGEGIKDPTRNLMCYSVRAVPGSPLTPRQSGLFFSYEYGSEQADAVRQDTVCVPSAIAP